MREMDLVSMSNAVKSAINACGIGILADTAGFRGAIKDFLSGSEFSAERHLLIFSVQVGIGSDLLRASIKSDSEWESALFAAKSLLITEYGLCLQRSEEIVSAFEMALKNERTTSHAHKEIIKTSGTKRKRARRNSQRYTITFGPYKWQMLGFSFFETLYIADEITDINIPFATETNLMENVSWEDCYIRKWLNSEFAGRFTAADLSEIKKDSGDTFFLLSAEKVGYHFGKGLGIDRDLKGCEDDGNPYIFADDCCDLRQAKYNGNFTAWWLKPTKTGMLTAVNSAGEIISDDRWRVCNTEFPTRVDLGLGVRPAFFMNNHYEDSK